MENDSGMFLAEQSGKGMISLVEVPINGHDGTQ